MRILVAENDGRAREVLARALGGPGTPDVRLDWATGDPARAAARAQAEGDPYALIILDPGPPPYDAARRVRAADNEAFLVLVTGARGFRPEAVARVAGPADRMLHLARPLRAAEVRQAAVLLGGRWRAERTLVAARADLRARVLLLQEEKLALAADAGRALHMATHDPLTDAPNRAAFARALADRARAPGHYAVAMLDLDRFKQVNDTLGHLAGDALIRATYATLAAAVPPGALAARLGGDEFGILFDCADEAAAALACDRVVAACAAPAEVFGHSVRGGASAGLAVAEGAADHDPQDVLRRADLALNDAKRAGRGMVKLYDRAMDEDVRFRRRIEQGLRRALAGNELSVLFQPMAERDGLNIAGFEALPRWETAEWGPVDPATFLAVAEESNLVHELGDWVMDRALVAAASWPGAYVSVNVSPRQFRRDDFVGCLADRVARAGVAPGRVQLEVTEAAIFGDAGQAADTLGRLRSLGFRTALDDFGAGYSSLTSIRTLALDCLKIDRGFVDAMGREQESAAIVHSIIHLGRSLGLGVVAEGVETAGQVQALRLAGATHLQGSFLSPPITAEAACVLAGSGAVRGFEQAPRSGANGTDAGRAGAAAVARPRALDPGSRPHH